MQGFNLPFQPIPQRLYAPAELFQGYEPEVPQSWAKTLDFEIYRHFVMSGGTESRNPYIGMMQALHDQAIAEATTSYIEGRRVAAIIGDHEMPRSSGAYRNAALMARRLTRSGFLVCTGGGPGAMEAAHLGAALAGGIDAELDQALAGLATQPLVPALGRIVDSNGAIDFALVAAACAWFRPAFELAKSFRAPRDSLAVPTWQYGHEPPTPFATHIAKYFQNSIREDGLLAIARQGIVCMEGKAGTIQEVFQDSAQNYYELFGPPSPMVLFGVDYWMTSYPIVPVLRKLFAAQFAKYVLLTDSVEAAAQFIEQFPK